MSTAFASVIPTGQQPLLQGGGDIDQDSWNRVRQSLKQEAGDHSFEVWLAPLVMAGCDGDTVRLSAPSAFAADWVNGHYGDLLRRLWGQQRPGVRRVLVQAGAVVPPPPPVGR
ncbi:DnaA N-terminal domain-containing protein, partial [Sandarakinorhabdus rubra]|uniref:DnaA N-terminal domain-containing protein n=1 Tax=Sandarakinorhabdus rubra TaxID=2672568 RepID=UPI002E283F0F